MKASEAPEKIYIKPMPNPSDGYVGIAWDEPHKTMVEYTHTDSFIEKADEFIGSFFHPDDTELRNCLLKKFHEYMKGSKA